MKSEDLARSLQEHAEKVFELLEHVGKLDTDTMEPEEIVDLGQILWDLSSRASKTLGPLKTRLRKIAVERWGPEPGARLFTGYQGSECVVTVPAPILRIRPGADMEALKNRLGDVLFRDYFDIKYAPKRNFTRRVTACSDPERQKDLLATIDQGNGTPRVSFR